MLNKLHKEFGYIAIFVSIVVYIVIFQSLYTFGEVGRIKVGILAALLFSIPSIIFLVIQLFILKRQTLHSFHKNEALLCLQSVCFFTRFI